MRDVPRCEATCWKGDPSNSMAAKARCKNVVSHNGPHLDENGNHFDDAGNIIVIGRLKNSESKSA